MRFLIILLSPILLNACAQAPTPQSHLLDFQKKMQAARHWKLVATKIADETLRVNQEGKAVYIPTHDVSQFGKSIRSYLLTEFTSRQIPITLTENGALQIDWSLEKIVHESRRYNQEGIFQALAVAVQTVFVGGADCSIPRTEVNLNVSITENQAVLSRMNETFYVNDKDLDHYAFRPDIKRYRENIEQKEYTLVSQ